MAYAAPYGTISPPNYAIPVGGQVFPQQHQQQPVSMHHAPSPQAVSSPPARPGTLPVGTRIMIGQYKVTIERFLSEGGFAHVYVARSSSPINVGGSSQTQHVLKRLAVPDKPQLQEVRKEVENMKRVSGHPHIVNFIEASASQLPGGAGYEIFILMEYAPGGGIIDMMNTRLQNRLTESEILKIFSDTVEAVAHMHHLSPPMMHRDLKVENILMASPSNYKLCDFGSATVPLPKAPSTMPEIQALEQDLNRTTTLQYRAPEMLDVWARKHVGLPADIWALGVFLYKLCYYTTPFEPHGVLAIQNVNYSFPRHPAYSDAIKELIANMLRGDASKRPDIAAVHRQVCRLRGISPKISTPSRSQGASSEPSAPALPRRPKEDLLAPKPSPSSHNKPSSVLSPVSSPQPSARPGLSLADAVAPMRRGRPTAHRNTPSFTAAPSSAFFGFDDAFKPPSASEQPEPPTIRSPSPPRPTVTNTEPRPSGSSEFQEFETLFPALDDQFGATKAQALSPAATAASTRTSPVSEHPTAPQIQRKASGFQDLLMPSPTTGDSNSAKDFAESKSPAPSLRVNTSGAPPPKPPKPGLVSTAAQTSPKLMERWFVEKSNVLNAARAHEAKTGEQTGQQQRPQLSGDSRSTRQKLVSLGEAPNGPSATLPEQIERLDLLADSPPAMDDASPNSNRPGPSHAIQDVQDALPTLRANFMRNGSMSMDGDSSTSMESSSLTGSTQSEALSDAMKRFQPIPEDEVSSSSSKSFDFQSDRVRRVPTVSTDSSDGEEEQAEPEDLDASRQRQPGRSSSGPSTPLAEVPPSHFTGTYVPSPRTLSSSSSQHTPALSPKPTFAARSRPPPEIIAPKPQQPKQVISNLVSRYESMSSSPEPPADGGAPLRKRPQSLYGTASSRGPSNSSSPAQDKAAPFKPSKPPPSGGPKPLTAPKPSARLASPKEVSPEEQPEETFVGVAKMKERWQSRAV